MPAGDDFSAEGWRTVAMGPMMAGAYVSTADHDGPQSFLKEAVAVAAAIVAARESAETELVRSVADWWSNLSEKPEIPGLTGGPESRQQLLDLLREADALVEERAPDALADYRLWCLECGLVAVRAHHEGAGPDSVTDAERAAFAELAAALHITKASG